MLDLDFNEQQKLLRAAAREFLTDECPTNLVRELEESELGYSPDLWKKMADLGWLGLIIPEQYGGSGGGMVDLVALCEELGRAVAPSPFLHSVVESGLLINSAGTEQQKRQFLPKIAKGEFIFTTALTEPAARYEPQHIQMPAKKQGNQYILNGTKMFVHDAHIADYMIVVARTGSGANPENGITLFIVEGKAPGISQKLLKTLASDRQSEVVFNNVAVPESNILGQVDGAWPVIDEMLKRATVALSAVMAGGSQAALEYIVEYAKIRVQFGRPIGTFQAVQHHVANMATATDAAKLASYEAAARMDAARPYDMEVAEAKATASEGYRFVTKQGHQINGGVGFYKEVDIQLWYRRAKAMEQWYGDADFHRRKVAQLLLAR